MSLRILIVVDLPWDIRLGACRVLTELTDQWRALGHSVELFSFTEAFPGARATRWLFALQKASFPRKAAAFIRAHSERFDIIDAIIGSLPYSAAELNFNGLVVARSIGLYRAYDRFERSVEQRWPHPRRGTVIGRLFYGFARHLSWRASERAVHKAGLLNVPNEEEAVCLREEAGVTNRILVQPYGLTTEYRKDLSASASPCVQRLGEERVCFIGMWSPRKGAYDWARIISRLRELVPTVRFRFLGIMTDSAALRRDLGSSLDDIELIPDYQPSELPGLLADCTVGAFPSYAEGFGLAVLDQLAAGLPTVAYDVAGPRDILARHLPSLLIQKGEVEAFAIALSDILRAPVAEYEKISQTCQAIASEFSWDEIAQTTLRTYQLALVEKVARRDDTPARGRMSFKVAL
ncbi:MAG: glycosyltransferase [Chthoniobacterales bacterium]|nr:glycosyltransferase [Chthoniobacterales bacterium]